MRRGVATAASVLAVLAVLSPALHERDSYPLSTYPMFSQDRGRVATIPTAVGFRADGSRNRRSPALIAGGIEVIPASVNEAIGGHKPGGLAPTRNLPGHADDKKGTR